MCCSVRRAFRRDLSAGQQQGYRPDAAPAFIGTILSIVSPEKIYCFLLMAVQGWTLRGLETKAAHRSQGFWTGFLARAVFRRSKTYFLRTKLMQYVLTVHF